MRNYTERDFKERFTKASDAAKYINELESLNLADITDEELEKLIDQYFHLIPFTSGRIPAGMELFRARLNIDERPFSLVKDIYVPPKNLIKDYGRANHPYEQIFYCSSNFKLASFEVIQNLKNSLAFHKEVIFLTVGVWKLKAPLHISSIYHNPILFDTRQDLKDWFANDQQLLNKGFFEKDMVNAHNLICGFFARQFTKNNIRTNNDYKISAFYTKRLKTSNSLIAPSYYSSRFDGINYPSVAMKYKGDNQAIFFESAEKKLELVNALQVVCANFDFDKGDFLPGILHEAESIKDGIINWKTEIYNPKI